MGPGGSSTVVMGLAAAVALVSGCGRGEVTDGQRDATRSGAADITASALRAHVEVLAHDSMRGRATPSPELEASARYVAAHFRAYGLRPGDANGTYLQRYPIPPEGEGSAPRLDSRLPRAEAYNAVGWIQGSDPVLRSEAMVLVAHMDGRGTGRPVEGDSILNGADDNASGTAALLELARTYGAMEPPPRRSLIFLAASGEERGLWGSQWYAAHPLVPLGRTVAALNMDMIGRNAPDTVVAVGKTSSSLGPLLDRIAAGRPELGLTAVGDDWPAELLFYRSDHLSFARRDVPSLLLFTGVHDDHHRISDEATTLDYEKMTRITRLAHHFVLAVADAENRPRWEPEVRRRVVRDTTP